MPASFFLRCCPLFSIAALSACGFEHRFGSSSNHAYEDHNTRGYEVPDLPADAGVTDPPSACDAIDRFKELLVIDRSVLQSDAAQNEIAGAAFSFRSVLERLADRPDDAARLFADWLDAWGAGDAIATPHASPPRARLRELLLDPWRRLGSAGLGPVARVPLRLIAIVNRVDLRDGVCGACGYRGELRLVYTGVDVTTGEALAMTLSVEVPYPRSRSARAWATAWHNLARRPFGTTFTNELAAVVRDVLSNADVQAVRIRTNETGFGAHGDSAWEMREFSLAEDTYNSHRLVGSLLPQTPRDDLDRSTTLRTWLVENELALRAGELPALPGEMKTRVAHVPHASFRWGSGVPISEAARTTFSAATCNGCHGGDRGADMLRFQHLAPWDAPGVYYGTSEQPTTRVSRYLHDPNGSKRDELTRRATSVQQLLCPEPSVDDCDDAPQDAYE